MIGSIYEQYVILARKKLKEIIEIKEEKKLKEEKAQYKNDILNAIVNYVKENYVRITRRNLEYLKFLKDTLIDAKKMVITVDIRSISRVLINVSGPMGWLVDEVGIEWDMVLDTVFIPASQIKGVISAAFQFYLASNIDLEVNKNVLEKIINVRNSILGGEKEQEHVSILNFTDAFPIDANNGMLLDRDIILPIYSKKIEEHLADPTPVHFLVVPPGVKFRFYIVVDEQRINKLKPERGAESSENKVKKIEEKSKIKLIDDIIKEYLRIGNISLKNREFSFWEILKNAFGIMGVGAKVSSGYGLFEIEYVG